MNTTLQSLCGQFMENRDTITKTFKMVSTYIYPVCANMFCAAGKTADREKLVECKRLLKEKTSAFSNFRGNLLAPVACTLALEDNPEEKLAQVLEKYALLKKEFWGSESLALTAFLLPDAEDVAEKAARGKRIYRRMKEQHPFLTSSEDSVFAVLMAFSDKSDDALIADMEECYALLKDRFGASNYVQAASHVLTLTDGTPTEKAGRMLELFDNIARAGAKYGKYYELPVLASLSALIPNPRQATSDLLEMDAFLAKQKGYGFWGMGKRLRLMHAAMLLADVYTENNHMNAAAISSTLALIASQQAALAATNAASAATR